MKINFKVKLLIGGVLIVLTLALGAKWAFDYAVAKVIGFPLQKSLEHQISTQLSSQLEMPVDASKSYILPTLTAEQRKLESEIEVLMSSNDESMWSEAAAKYVAGCVGSPKTGHNALLKFPDELAIKGRIRLIEIYNSSDRDQRRCAVSVLARHKTPSELVELWRELLTTGDLQLRWWGIVMLSRIADPADLPLVMKQSIEAPELRMEIASLLRKWHDARSIPLLVELAKGDDEWIRKRAIKSMESSAFAAQLQGQDAKAFASEMAWWNEMKSKTKGPLELEARWKRDGDVVAR